MLASQGLSQRDPSPLFSTLVVDGWLIKWTYWQAFFFLNICESSIQLTRILTNLTEQLSYPTTSGYQGNL